MIAVYRFSYLNCWCLASLVIDYVSAQHSTLGYIEWIETWTFNEDTEWGDCGLFEGIGNAFSYTVWGKSQQTSVNVVGN
jgi:hypothetical protein